MQYLVIYEKENDTFGAYVPDLPGCVAVAKSKARVRKLIREAIELHLEDLRDTGHKPPRPRATSELVLTP